ncbi:MAG TPA: IS256 family transposase [Planctomycetota bacterium]|nr:IS256 family transposase [Planctomycetota bacterium]
MGESKSAVVTLPEVFGPDLLTEGIRSRLRALIETMIEAELDAALEAARYARTESRAGTRNGSKPRTLHTSFGPVELEVPRARLRAREGAREWRSEMLPRYQRRTPRLDETLLGLYLSGTNLRRIQAALRPLLDGAPVGKNVVSRLTRRLRDHLEAWKHRSLKETSYVYLYLDATNLNVKVLGRVRKVPVLVALGVRLDGQKEILAMEPQVREREASWREVLESVTRRGFNRPTLVVIDGHAGLRVAIDATWPGVKVQRCCVHKLRNLQMYCLKEEYPQVRRDFHEIAGAESRPEAEAALRKFVRASQERAPKVVRSLEEAGPELLTFYDFPQEQWKGLRTTNPIERLNLEFKRRVKTQGSLPSEASAVLLLFELLASGQLRFKKIAGASKIVDVVKAVSEQIKQAS